MIIYESQATIPENMYPSLLWLTQNEEGII